jgi:hypothetical protein
MAEMTAANMVVSLPSMKAHIRRGGILGVQRILRYSLSRLGDDYHKPGVSRDSFVFPPTGTQIAPSSTQKKNQGAKSS